MKERLTGAIILVALVVLLVPELLTGPIRSARTVAMAASAEGAPLRAYTIHLADDTRAQSAAADTSGPQQPALLPAPAPTTVTAPSAPLPSSEPPPPPPPPRSAQPPAIPPNRAPASATSTHAAPTAQQSPAGGAEAFTVQLGSFASRANAERLAHQVRSQGFQAGVSRAASGRRLYRVRVGPAPDHAAASELAQQLRAAGHSGSIVPR